jgi:hypothetical protein
MELTHAPPELVEMFLEIAHSIKANNGWRPPARRSLSIIGVPVVFITRPQLFAASEMARGGAISIA